jgi:hypothetical protein
MNSGKPTTLDKPDPVPFVPAPVGAPAASPVGKLYIFKRLSKYAIAGGLYSDDG